MATDAPGPSIRHVSDTARWSAVFRARETERDNALFRDPYAARLAGERGEQIAAMLPFHDKHSWSWVARTYSFDSFISEQIERGADMVINLAAGLDARPYRMALPGTLQWIEVDFPEILAYKEAILSGESPKCRLRRVRMDLADSARRRELFDELAQQSKKALVLSEGLLVYLADEEAAALAQELAARPAFHAWVVDIVSPGLLKMLQKNTHQEFGENVSRLKFAPAEGPAYFARYGWKPADVRSMVKTAARLKRLPLFPLRFFALFPENPARSPSRPWSGVCLLEKDMTLAASGPSTDSRV